MHFIHSYAEKFEFSVRRKPKKIHKHSTDDVIVSE